MPVCKQCNNNNTNGTNFCTRKCRTRWVREHKVKGGKKRAKLAIEREAMTYGSDFSNENDCQNSY